MKVMLAIPHTNEPKKRQLHDSIDWIPQASGDMGGWQKLTKLPMNPGLPHASCQPLVSPLAAIFKLLSLALFR